MQYSLMHRCWLCCSCMGSCGQKWWSRIRTQKCLPLAIFRKVVALRRGYRALHLGPPFSPWESRKLSLLSLPRLLVGKVSTKLGRLTYTPSRVPSSGYCAKLYLSNVPMKVTLGVQIVYKGDKQQSFLETGQWSVLCLPDWEKQIKKWVKNMFWTTKQYLSVLPKCSADFSHEDTEAQRGTMTGNSSEGLSSRSLMASPGFSRIIICEMLSSFA